MIVNIMPLFLSFFSMAIAIASYCHTRNVFAVSNYPCIEAEIEEFGVFPSYMLKNSSDKPANNICLTISIAPLNNKWYFWRKWVPYYSVEFSCLEPSEVFPFPESALFVKRKCTGSKYHLEGKRVLQEHSLNVPIDVLIMVKYTPNFYGAALLKKSQTYRLILSCKPEEGDFLRYQRVPADVTRVRRTKFKLPNFFSYLRHSQKLIRWKPKLKLPSFLQRLPKARKR
jgi:hypothetical protein